MNLINKEEFLELLEQKYGDLNDEGGCSICVNGEYEWLSISNIVELAHDCELYDDDQYELEQAEETIEDLKKKIEEIKTEYKKRLELMQTALIELTHNTNTVPTDKRISKADFIEMHSNAVRDMDGIEDSDIYGYDITVHWHGFYCNCGDGATPANYIIPGVADCLDEDPTEY